MMKCLIVYATREGQTRKIARRLAGHLQDKGIAVVLHDARDSFSQDVRAFDYLVCGASLHAGGVEKEIRKFINRYRDDIASMPRSFFLVLLSAATRDQKLRKEWLLDAETRFKEQVNLPFKSFEMIAGALRYSKYPLPLKWIMKNIAEKAGERTDISKDYEYTDWGQVKRFADEIFTAMSGQA